MHGEIHAAIERIDRANGVDPNRCDGAPLAQLQGSRAHGWVLRLDPAASAALQIAARAHHLGRWTLPRSDYPSGRAGYLRWRREQRRRHGVALAELLVDHDQALVARAVEIVTKQGLGVDAEVQVFEDAVCLTFLETQFADTAEKLDQDAMVGVVAKTLAKMSAAGRAAALEVDLDPRGAAIVAAALDRSSPEVAPELSRAATRTPGRAVT